MVPAKIVLVASEILRIGIKAVVKFSSIPGNNPIAAGIITIKFRGVIMLCASLKDFEKIDNPNSTEEKKAVRGNNKDNTITIDFVSSSPRIAFKNSGGISPIWRIPI